MGEYYAGDLLDKDIQQPEWYVLLKAVPITGLNVRQLLQMRKHEPVTYNYWLKRAVAANNAEGKADRLLKKALKRLKGLS